MEGGWGGGGGGGGGTCCSECRGCNQGAEVRVRQTSVQSAGLLMWAIEGAVAEVI